MPLKSVLIVAGHALEAVRHDHHGDHPVRAAWRPDTLHIWKPADLLDLNLDRYEAIVIVGPAPEGEHQEAIRASSARVFFWADTRDRRPRVTRVVDVLRDKLDLAHRRDELQEMPRESGAVVNMPGMRFPVARP